MGKRRERRHPRRHGRFQWSSDVARAIARWETAHLVRAIPRLTQRERVARESRDFHESHDRRRIRLLVYRGERRNYYCEVGKFDANLGGPVEAIAERDDGYVIRGARIGDIEVPSLFIPNEKCSEMEYRAIAVERFPLGGGVHQVSKLGVPR